MKTDDLNRTPDMPKNATRCSIPSSLKRQVGILVFVLGTLALLLSPPAIQLGYCFGPTDGLDLQANSKGGDDKISYEELVKLLNDALKDAQQVNLFVDACHSGGLVTAGAKLNMPYFIAVSQKDPKDRAVNGSSTKDVVPGRLTISPVGKNNYYFFGFAEYWTKELKKAVEVPTAESLFITSTDDVKKDPSMKTEKPTSTSGNNADPKRNINGGDKSNHALIFDGDRGNLSREPGLELYRALADKFGFRDNGNSLQFYDNGYKPQDFEGTHIDGTGSLENLKKALQQLKTLIANNPKKELVNIFINGHGYEQASLAPRQTGLDGIPNDGYLVQGGTPTSFDVPTNSVFWAELKVNVLTDDRMWIRVQLPSFMLDVSESSLHAPIAIAVAGMPLGYFNMASTSTGAELNVALPDSYTRLLLAAADGAPSSPITFSAAPGDWFRIATEDDVFLNPAYQKGSFGFGIATSVANVDYVNRDSQQ